LWRQAFSVNIIDMSKFSLRPANSKDFPAIKRLIHLVQINPTGLNWRRFVVAVDKSGRMLGCGQLKPHGRGIVELASIAVEPSDRNKGVARAVIEYLIKQTPRPLYLTCLSSMGVFYEKWGFRPITMNEMPTYFRRLVQLVKMIPSWGEHADKLLVMKLM
jgi:N-acetylglutamate synthase-like GNAT family acetyltransferase